MKLTLLILSFSFSLLIHSQNSFDHTPTASLNLNLYSQDYSFDFFMSGSSEATNAHSIMEGERFSFLDASSFVKPLPPVLTTNSSELEICTGNSTRLTASSSSLIRWYSAPPPLGTPVGTGSIFITPELSTGYYTYYAIAEEDGIKSEVSAMEVVMVYPRPELKITSSANLLCINQTATLSASGSTYLEWENGTLSTQLSITPTITTSYKITGINTAGCKSTAEFTQRVEKCGVSERGTVGIDKAKEIHHAYKVYPNPTNGEFHVAVTSISENTKVELYNAYGNLIYSSRITHEITALDLKDEADGIYILRIYENDQVLVQEKILKY